MANINFSDLNFLQDNGDNYHYVPQPAKLYETTEQIVGTYKGNTLYGRLIEYKPTKNETSHSLPITENLVDYDIWIIVSTVNYSTPEHLIKLGLTSVNVSTNHEVVNCLYEMNNKQLIVNVSYYTSICELRYMIYYTK